MATAIFINFVYVYMLRLNVNIVIIAMVNYTAIPHANLTVSDQCQDVQPTELAESTDFHHQEGEFLWDEKTQSLVSVSFFWGYVVTQLIGGRLAERIGSKYLIAGSQTAAGLLTLILPALARTGRTELFIAGRILLGLAQGVFVPAVQPLVAKWAPKGEQNTFATFVSSGSLIGTSVAILSSGLLADWLGWPSVFYVQGAMAVPAVIFWLAVVENSPDGHRWISDKEKEFIRDGTVQPEPELLEKVPW